MGSTKTTSGVIGVYDPDIVSLLDASNCGAYVLKKGFVWNNSTNTWDAMGATGDLFVAAYKLTPTRIGDTAGLGYWVTLDTGLPPGENYELIFVDLTTPGSEVYAGGLRFNYGDNKEIYVIPE